MSAAQDTRPVVDRDALAERLFLMFRTVLYGTRLPERWDGIYHDEKPRWLRYADSILAAGVVQDAADVRRAVAEEIAAAIEAQGRASFYTDCYRAAARIAREVAHPRSP